MKNKQTKLLKGWQKVIIILLCVILAPIIALFAYTIIDTVKGTNKPVATKTQKTEYIDFEKSDVKEVVEGEVTITPISSFNGNRVKNKLKEKKDFSFADYYDLDTVLDKMMSTSFNKTEDLSVLNSDNKVDADRLYEVVLRNNKSAKQEKVNAINTFYSDASDEEIGNICKLIAKTVNETADDRDIRETASLLSRLKIFRHMTSTDLAGVTDSIVFYFNPNMINMTRDMFEISGRKDETYDDETLTFVHEIEHLKQKASDDGNKENGTEAGFCRKFDELKVNSLWNQWVLEAAAEMKMSEYLDAKPRLYGKKISYVKSYELCNIFNDNKELNSLINSTFDNDLESAYKRLQLKSEAEQRDFLNSMYSIQLLQYDCDDFWDYYQEKTGKQLTEEEQLALKMDIRTEVIYNLTEKYYNGLIKGIENGNIQDIETVYYMMKIWELDCCGHLSYTEKDTLGHAKVFIIWLNDIQNLMFNMLAESTGKTQSKIEEEYNLYHPLINNNGKTTNNYRFNDITEKKTKFIENCFDGYSVTYFSSINHMISNIEK